jgi:hypothetical protein
MELCVIGKHKKSPTYAETDFSLLSIEQLRKSHKKGASQALAERLKAQKLKTPLVIDETLYLDNPKSKELHPYV